MASKLKKTTKFGIPCVKSNPNQPHGYALAACSITGQVVAESQINVGNQAKHLKFQMARNAFFYCWKYTFTCNLLNSYTVSYKMPFLETGGEIPMNARTKHFINMPVVAYIYIDVLNLSGLCSIKWIPVKRRLEIPAIFR